MDKSKLPKLAKLKPPTTFSHSTLEAKTPMLNNPSCEFKHKLPGTSTDIKQNLKKPFVTKINPIRPQKLSRRSKSLSDLRPTFKSLKNDQPQISVGRVGAKRPATTKIEPDNKPKIIKQPKIPDWDYKSRFQNLTERHTKLQDAHKKLKEQVEGIDELEEQHNVLLAEHDDLQKNYNRLEIEEKNKTKQLEKLKNIEKDINELKIKYDELYTKSVNMTSTIDELTLQNSNLKTSLDKQISDNKELNQLVSRLKTDNTCNETLRRKLHNTIQDLKGNIRVFCRVRPPINDIEREKLKCLINYPDENSLDIRKSKESINSISGKPTDCKLEFIFDYVFTEEATQAEFFEELAQLVQSAIDGYHVCVFAYGQTGSGKTYTMQGVDAPEHIGMIPRTVNLIFDTIETLRRTNWVYDVKVSFLEIYNENVRDLLDPNANHSLDICFNEGKGTTVTNLRIESITSYKEFDTYQQIAQRNRMVAATDFNEHSSRSHAITKIYLSGINEENKLYYTGSINLVDLAGSECAKTSHGDRLIETKSINKSLSNLGTVMLALHNKDKHIPYRNSKLTYLLQSCLGGNSKTLMIVNISPFEDNYGESVSSLRFAAKVKEVKTKVRRNKTAMPLSAINNSQSN